MAEKILVVDDEYLLLNMLVETLKSKGYETFCTSDGFKAMRMMAEVSRDLIIKDVMMQNWTGTSSHSTFVGCPTFRNNHDGSARGQCCPA